jgi:predicted DNA-binding transcriptional regulator AlpA
MTHHLMGLTEIADLFGVSRQRVDQIVKKDPSFPTPEAVLTGGRIWKRVDVEAWARKTGRLPPPRDTDVTQEAE